MTDGRLHPGAEPIQRRSTWHWHPAPAPSPVRAQIEPLEQDDDDLDIDVELEDDDDDDLDLGEIDDDLLLARTDDDDDDLDLGEIDGDLVLPRLVHTRGDDFDLDLVHAYTDDEPADRGVSTETRADPPVGPALRPGDVIPGTRIRVSSRVSEGASGIVYRGEHIDLERPLAIKVLRRELSSTHARLQFLHEARTIAAIESPYVARVTDFGRLPGGRPWYAMEFVDGCSLAAHIADAGPLDLPTTITLLRMVAKALATCHAHGIVHCDVKPANLLLRAGPRGPELVLVDFGIARPVGSRPVTLCGTPDCMAPEQIERDVVDGRTDQYALACCGFEMLTGCSLFAGCSPDEMMLRHVEGVELAFDDALGIPPRVEQVLARALRPTPADRYPSMAAFEAALCEIQRACGLSSATSLEPPEAEAVRQPHGESHRRTAAMALTSVAALGGLVVGLAYAVGP